jgi:hypothetical protein
VVPVPDYERIPRLHAYLERTYDRAVLWMLRSDWERHQATTTGYVPVTIETTPMRRVGQEASTIAAVAIALSADTAELKLYRFDVKDAPLPINEDRYYVHMDLVHHPSLPKWAAGASTSLNENLIGFLADHVAFVKMDRGPDHHLAAAPATVQAVWDSRAKSS